MTEREVPATPALFDRIGGDPLREVLRDFYDRVFGDVMIGFMFTGVDRNQLVEREWELVAALLGAGVKYSGRPMRTAHARHTIFGGQFERRMQLLRQVLRERAVDAEVQRAWLEHAESLRGQITRDAGSECGTGEQGKLAIAPPADPDAPVRLRRK
jgi:hemoglobin